MRGTDLWWDQTELGLVVLVMAFSSLRSGAIRANARNGVVRNVGDWCCAVNCGPGSPWARESASRRARARVAAEGIFLTKQLQIAQMNPQYSIRGSWQPAVMTVVGWCPRLTLRCHRARRHWLKSALSK